MKRSILFVCLGNICRSPAAEGILRHLLTKHPDLEIRIESCGIGDWHKGQLPDQRMRQAASDRGVTLASRAQQFRPEFFDEFDDILAMDKEVLHDLYRHAKTPEHKSKVHLLTEFSTTYRDEEIPDPYYGSRADFDLVLDMLEDSCEEFIQRIKKQSSKPL
jgi:protein-tyrosine phosphatase